jgi:hypothetical protein
MFWVDHPPPHFHAVFGEYEALIAIDTTAIIAGSLPLVPVVLWVNGSSYTVRSSSNNGNWRGRDNPWVKFSRCRD